MQSDGKLSRLEPASDEMYLLLKNEISNRIRHVCDKMPENEFDEFVGKMARLEMKYRGRDGRTKV